MRMDKKRCYALSALLLLASCVGTPNPKQSSSSITTSNDVNAQLSFYYYLPGKVLKNRDVPRDVLICLPGMYVNGPDFVDGKMRSLADEQNLIIVAPSFAFDAANFDSQTSYQFPEAWSGQALLNILEKVKSDEGVHFSKLYLYGVSAGAQFALRFSILHPELCVACAAHASGGRVTPLVKNDIKYFIGIGKSDTPERVQNAQLFRSDASALGMDVTYREYPGGHLLGPIEEDESLDFVRKIHQSTK